LSETADDSVGEALDSLNPALVESRCTEYGASEVDGSPSGTRFGGGQSESRTKTQPARCILFGGFDNSQAAPRTGLDGRLGERPGPELRLDIDRRVQPHVESFGQLARESPSLNGVLRSGRLAAEAVLAALGLASEKRRPTER